MSDKNVFPPYDNRLPDDVPDQPEHEDYQPLPPTERHSLADDMAGWIVANDLAQTHGGAALRDDRGRFYFIRFSRRGIGTGQVNVWSPGYITVWWNATVPGLEPEGRRTFGSLEHAQTFMELAFVDGNGVSAMTVPERVWVIGRKADQEARRAAQGKTGGKGAVHGDGKVQAGPDNWRDYIGPEVGGEG